jgi:hypothetical protein
MITLTRRQARCLSGVFRRPILGTAHQGPIPPLILSVEEGQLRARHRYGAIAVEHAGPSAWPSSGSVSLPLEALADLGGRDDSNVALEAAVGDRTVVRWSDRGIPQSRQYPVATIEGLPPFPEPPRSWSSVSRRPARGPGRGRRHGRRGRRTSCPGLPGPEGRDRHDRRHRRPPGPDPGRPHLPPGGPVPGPFLAPVRRPGTARLDRQDRHPRRRPRGPLGPLAGGPGRPALPLRRPDPARSATRPPGGDLTPDDRTPGGCAACSPTPRR